jgi:hypothetical protein
VHGLLSFDMLVIGRQVRSARPETLFVLVVRASAAGPWPQIWTAVRRKVFEMM